MIGLKEQFNTKSAEEWLADLKKELNEEDFKRLSEWNDLEGLEEHAINHSQDLLNSFSSWQSKSNNSSGLGDSTVGNGVRILIEDEHEANKTALELLMKGADYLVFDFPLSKEKCTISALFQGIQFEYIKVKFIPSKALHVEQIFEYFDGKLPQTCWFGYDHFARKEEAIFEELSKHARAKQYPFLEVNGYGIQQLGANCQQELSFSLAVAHEYLVLLMEQGLSVDEASACIHFHSGVGSSFFYEIAKFRSMRLLYAKVIEVYKPEHGCSTLCHISASLGYINKSVSDPDTNLLRQTTEVLSAVSAGVDSIVTHEIDHGISEAQTKRYQRMSRNILPILQNESKLDALFDPVAGSYLAESLTNKLCEAVWKHFQEIEGEGGIFQQNALTNFLQEHVLSTRKKRIQRLLNGTDHYIGINTLQTEKETKIPSNSDNQYLGIPYLSLENEFNKQA